MVRASCLREHTRIAAPSSLIQALRESERLEPIMAEQPGERAGHMLTTRQCLPAELNRKQSDMLRCHRDHDCNTLNVLQGIGFIFWVGRLGPSGKDLCKLCSGYWSGTDTRGHGFSCFTVVLWIIGTYREPTLAVTIGVTGSWLKIEAYCMVQVKLGAYTCSSLTSFLHKFSY